MPMSLLVLAVVIGGILIIVGAKKIGLKIILGACILALLLPVGVAFLASFWTEAAGKSRLAIVVAVIVLLAVVLLLNRTLARIAWAGLAVFLKLSFRLGAWIVTAVTRFPWVLLPQPEKFLVAVLAFIAVNATLVSGLVFIGSGRFPWVWPLALWGFTFLLAIVGRWRYLRHERKGLAHVAQ